MSTPAVRVYWYICAGVYVIWSAYRIPKLPPDETIFASIGASVFFLLYLFPITVFGSDIKVQDKGIEVVQYRQSFIPFSNIKRCYSLFLVPFRIVVVITDRKFPMRVLVSGDKGSSSNDAESPAGTTARRIRAALSTTKTQISSTRTSGS